MVHKEALESRAPSTRLSLARIATAVLAVAGRLQVLLRNNVSMAAPCGFGAFGVAQFTRVQVWPPQNMPPKAQPCTRSRSVPFIAIVES